MTASTARSGPTGHRSTPQPETWVKQSPTSTPRFGSHALADEFSGTYSYQGTTTTESDLKFDTDGNGTLVCRDPDGANTIDFGYTAGSLGATCNFQYSSTNTTIRETDIRLSTAAAWTQRPRDFPSGCHVRTNKRWDVLSVMTHEMGHAFGLGDIRANADAQFQTMYFQVPACTKFMRTLARGDVRGFRAVD